MMLKQHKLPQKFVVEVRLEEWKHDGLLGYCAM
jgi:hypothetical protein